MINIENFLLLLRADLGKDTETELDFSTCDWEETESLAIKQGVLPILFDGYKNFFEQKQTGSNKFKPLPTEVMLRWYAVTQQAERHYGNHLKSIRSLTSFLAAKSYRIMIPKDYSFLSRTTVLVAI